MDVKQVFFLIILQGFLLGFVCRSVRMQYRITALLGSCVELHCTHDLVGTSETSTVIWYSENEGEIFNTKNLSSVMEEYRNRTSMAPDKNSCTLRIDPVKRRDRKMYYSINADTRMQYDLSRYYFFEQGIFLYVRDSPKELLISVPELLTEENVTTLQCSTEHTCGSSPPIIQWNKPGEIMVVSTTNSKEFWVERSELTYIPSYVDDGTPVRCTATYPNGQKTERSAELKILFAPKHVTVTMMENDDIIEGSDVNLMCISVSKPEVTMYEWYKGRNRMILPNTGWKMTVRNVTRDVEPYSCAAMNSLGRGKSALMEIPVLYKGSGQLFRESNSKVILLATIGAVCPLLILLIVFLYWRKRCKKVTSSDAVEPPDATYCNLMKKDDTNTYEELNPMNSTYIPTTGGHVGAASQFGKTPNKSNIRTVQSFTSRE